MDIGQMYVLFYGGLVSIRMHPKRDLKDINVEVELAFCEMVAEAMCRRSVKRFERPLEPEAS